MRLALFVLMTALTAGCSSLGQIRDTRVDPGAPYRPQPDPETAPR